MRINLDTKTEKAFREQNFPKYGSTVAIFKRAIGLISSSYITKELLETNTISEIVRKYNINFQYGLFVASLKKIEKEIDIVTPQKISEYLDNINSVFTVPEGRIQLYSGDNRNLFNSEEFNFQIPDYAKKIFNTKWNSISIKDGELLKTGEFFCREMFKINLKDFKDDIEKLKEDKFQIGYMPEIMYNYKQIFDNIKIK